LSKTPIKRRAAPQAAAGPAVDTPAQQLGARGVLWLAALAFAAVAAGGLSLAISAIQPGLLLPLRAGFGIVLAALGGAGCLAGIYAANHSRLAGGRLMFDQAARSLVTAPWFARALKWSGHATGITVLAISWLSYIYPAGIPLP
jgi:hypothetical protein